MTTIRSTLILTLAAVVLYGQAQTPDSVDYLNRAREVLENALSRSRQDNGPLRIEVAAGPIFPPDHERLHPTREGASAGRAALSGRVLDEQWAAIGGAVVSIRGSGNAAQSVSAVSNADGVFQLFDLAPAGYVIEVTPPNIPSRSWTLDLAAGHRRVLVKMNEGLQSLFSGGDPLGPQLLFASYRGNDLVRFDLMGGLEPEIKATVPREQDNGGQMELLRETERKQANMELAPFLAAFYDVARGPERFERFLPPGVLCRIYNSGERVIPTIDQRRCVASVLDDWALASWFTFEGFAGRYSPDDLFFQQPSRAASDEERLRVSMRRRETLRTELRLAGFLDGEHSAQMQQYFQRATGAMPIVKSRLTEEMLSLFPELKGKTLYLTGVGNSFLFFTREESELRLAGVIAAGG